MALALLYLAGFDTTHCPSLVSAGAVTQPLWEQAVAAARGGQAQGGQGDGMAPEQQPAAPAPAASLAARYPALGTLPSSCQDKYQEVCSHRSRLHVILSAGTCPGGHCVAFSLSGDCTCLCDWLGRPRCGGATVV